MPAEGTAVLSEIEVGAGLCGGLAGCLQPTTLSLHRPAPRVSSCLPAASCLPPAQLSTAFPAHSSSTPAAPPHSPPRPAVPPSFLPQVAIGASKSKFSSAVTSQGRISVAGGVKAGLPFLTRIGSFDVDLALEVGAAP